MGVKRYITKMEKASDWLSLCAPGTMNSQVFLLSLTFKAVYFYGNNWKYRKTNRDDNYKAQITLYGNTDRLWPQTVLLAVWLLFRPVSAHTMHLSWRRCLLRASWWPHGLEAVTCQPPCLPVSGSAAATSLQCRLEGLWDPTTPFPY